MAARVLHLILIGISLFSVPALASSDGRLEREFSQRLTTITVENPDGITEAQTWAESTVRVIASRANSDGDALNSEVSFGAPAPDHLRVAVRLKGGGHPVRLTLYVPGSMHLAVRSIRGNVTIMGELAGLSVHTESGAITLHLPEGSNCDLSLRAIRGAIESRVPLKIFGRTDAHVLDARAGQGGSTVIVRSSLGNISVLPDVASRIAMLSRTADNLDKTGPINSLAKTPGSKLNPTVEPRSSSDRDGIHSGEELLKLEARLVNLNVKVTDVSGKTLPALRKEDFVVYEDDVKQVVSYFEPVTAPLNIVLLLDLSGSTEHKIKTMKKAAQKFVDSLKPTDRIAVAGFTRRFFVISNFTTDHRLLKDRIDDIKNRHSGTAYYDAMWATLDLLDEANATRKAIVVLTDGVDNSLDHPNDSEFDPKHGFDELLTRIEEADTTIYPIYLDTEYETVGMSGRNGHAAYVTARKQLAALAEQTGAAMFKAERAEDLEGVYQQVAAELHSLYSMAYTPELVRTDGKWRKINIAVALPGAKVRTKRGYFAK
ncbi:MAG: VWA domain-containing protein [Acidobacteriota bacterium]